MAARPQRGEPTAATAPPLAFGVVAIPESYPGNYRKTRRNPRGGHHPIAVDRLHELYDNRSLGGLREVIRTVDVTITDACDGRFQTITTELAYQAAVPW